MPRLLHHISVRYQKTNCLGEYVNEGPSDPARRISIGDL